MGKKDWRLKKKREMKARSGRSSGMSSGTRKKGKADVNVYSSRTETIHQAKHAFDENPPQQILDLCLIMDCTGSMGSWIQHCKETLVAAIDDTVAKDPECKVRVAFVGFRDFCDQELFTIHDFSYDVEAVKKFINSACAKGGGDAPEDVQGGLRKALDLSWSALDDSVKLAYLVADAPCHGSQYHNTNDDYPAGNPAGLVLEDLLREFSDKEILVTAYKLTDQTEKMYSLFKDAYNQGREQDGVEFVDIRGQVKASRSTSRGLYSREVREAYSGGMVRSKSVQCRKQRKRKKGWS